MARSAGIVQHLTVHDLLPLLNTVLDDKADAVYQLFSMFSGLDALSHNGEDPEQRELKLVFKTISNHYKDVTKESFEKALAHATTGMAVIKFASELADAVVPESEEAIC